MSARFTESVMLEQFQLPEDCLCNNFQKTKKTKTNKHTQKNINNMEASYNQKYDYKKKQTKTKMKNPDYTLTLKKIK